MAASQYQSIGAVVQNTSTGIQYQTTYAVVQETAADATVTFDWLAQHPQPTDRRGLIPGGMIPPHTEA